jgi:hypothetical protein
VRIQAAKALGHIRDPRSVGPLAAALRDPDNAVREQASKALASIGAPAVETLVTALGDADWRVRWEAVSTLDMIPDPRAANAVNARAKELAPVKDAYVEFLKKAEPPNEDRLIDALSLLGTVGMARDLLRCGYPKLEEAGRRWLESHGHNALFLRRIGKGPR